MVDHVSITKRSQIMAAVKAKNTKAELIIRSLLYGAGYRYRLHKKDLPGKPDIVMAKHRAVIFVNGCFWHGHGCYRSKSLPKTREIYWGKKILANKQRDEKNISELISYGWRVCIIWDCALTRKQRLDPTMILLKLDAWLKSDEQSLEILGK